MNFMKDTAVMARMAWKPTTHGDHPSAALPIWFYLDLHTRGSILKVGLLTKGDSLHGIFQIRTGAGIFATRARRSEPVDLMLRISNR
jgi:hypothetical protein